MTGLTPDITDVSVVAHGVLDLTFADGLRADVAVLDRLRGPVFQQARTPEGFANVSVDNETGTVVWPGGADLAPDTLYVRVKTGAWPGSEIAAQHGVQPTTTGVASAQLRPLPAPPGGRVEPIAPMHEKQLQNAKFCIARLARIDVGRAKMCGGAIEIAGRYSERRLPALRALPERRFDAERKIWTAPLTRAGALALVALADETDELVTTQRARDALARAAMPTNSSARPELPDSGPGPAR